ncbi:hypothetical protein CU633_19360 [Bacillus sp. V3-13]|nr:hypothetical protein CU633_19360 [Bacillus sp. V3-13]
MNSFFLVSILLLVLFSLVACSSSQSQTKTGTEIETEATGAEKGGSLVYAISNDVDGLDPHRTVSASTFQVTNNVFDTLVGTTPEGELKPRLAKDWASSEDGLTWTFNLESGVTFHNGREMTAEDVVYSFERLKAAESPRAAEFSNIIDVKADGSDKVVMILGKADATFISSLAMPWSAIVAKEADADMKKNPIGTGPFKLEEWVPQQKVILNKNEDYFIENKPMLDKVTFSIIPEATTLLANLQAGEVDIVGVSGEQVSSLESDPAIEMMESPLNMVQVLAFNNSHEPLNNVKVRQAISMAINKADIIEGAGWGYGTEIGSHMAPTSPYYADTTSVLPFDADKAKSLLKEAGFADGLKLKLTLPEPYKLHVDSGQMIAEQLKQIGVEVEIEVIEWGKWVDDVYKGRNYEMTVISHTGRLDPDAMLARYHSQSGENYYNYKNQEIDQLLTEAKVELNEQKRKEMYTKIQEILAEEVPAVYIQAPDSIIAMNKKVEGLQIYPIDIIDLSNISLEQ